MHDLLRAYATHIDTGEDSEQERRAALTRLFDHYLATAGAAMDTLHPVEAHRRPRVPPIDTPSPPVTEPGVARAWLDTERVTLTAVCAHTATRGWPEHTTGLATTLYRYLEIGGHYPEAVSIHTHALHAARDAGDPVGEAAALTNLGFVYRRQGRYQQAAEHHQQALALFREIGNRAGEAAALTNLGFVYRRQGRYQQAVEHHQQALALFREICNRAGEAEALNGIGETHYATGHHDQAHAHHTAALTLATQIGDRYEQARAHDGLAHTHHATGDLDQARHHWCQALALYTALGVPEAEDVHAHLAALDQARGDDNED